MDSDPTNLGLGRTPGSLRRHAAWVLLCVALVAGAAYGVSKQQAKRYTATASLVFTSNRAAQQNAGLTVTHSSSQRARQAANLERVQRGDLAAKTARRLGEGLTKAKVSAALSVSERGESNIVNVSAGATSPVLAAAIANTYARLLGAAQKHRDHIYDAAALRRVNKKLAALSRKARAAAAGRALRSRATSLELLVRSPNGSSQVTHAASVPTSPASPRIVRNTVLGAVLGLLLGLSLALMLGHLGRRIREPEALASLYRLPLLGIVPRSRALSRASRPHAQAGLEPLPQREEEVFQLIRARLRYFNIDRELRTLLVVSSAPGDGKTTIARHLARAVARMGSAVLLLEADLRHPALAGQLNLQPGPGLSDVLIGELSLWSATQLVDVDSGPVDGSAGRSMDVLAAGAPLPPNPATLIESQALEGVLEEARSTYDLVVIDTPPLAATADAYPLLGKVDGVVLVAMVGRRGRRAAKRLQQALEGARAPWLGVIANGAKAHRRGSHHADQPYVRGFAHGPFGTCADDDGEAGADRSFAAMSPNGGSAPIPDDQSDGLYRAVSLGAARREKLAQRLAGDGHRRRVRASAQATPVTQPNRSADAAPGGITSEDDPGARQRT
jgi:tyrosine-protein kinase